MSKIVAISLLALISAPAFANVIPSPDVLPLLGIGVAAALLVARRSKKKS